MLSQKINIVNDNDEIIGEESRSTIHSNGLLHREVHVWFYTPKGEIVFQHRAKDKETYPDLLDATVGGHVEIGATYEETAVKEMEEETGITVSINDILFLKKIKARSEDIITNKINYAFKSQYAYLFKGSLADLKPEEGKIIGFELWPIGIILNINENDRKRFISGIFNPETIELFKMINNLSGQDGTK